ncbi:MAG: hypothetical protein K0R15_1337 [Clostridiales bacterium]|nr:hypothetical protein [Clostridiales bacterium]
MIAILNKVLLPEMRNITNISKVAEGQALIDSIRARQPEFIPDGYDDLYDNRERCEEWFLENVPYGKDVSILTNGIEFNYKNNIWNNEYACIDIPYIEKMFTLFLKSFKCTIENGNYYISGYVPESPYGFFTAISINFRNTNISDDDNQINFLTVGVAKNMLMPEYLLKQGEKFKIQVPTKIAKDGEMYVSFTYLTEGQGHGKYDGILSYHFKGVNPFMGIVYPNACKVGSTATNDIDTTFQWDFSKMWEIIR